MVRARRNPVQFAVESMYALLNAHGEFTYTRNCPVSSTLRVQLQQTRGITLQRSLIDLDGDRLSIFHHGVLDVLILLAEINCRVVDDCHRVHGEVTLVAKTFEGLTSAIFLCEDDGVVEDQFSSAGWHGDGATS